MSLLNLLNSSPYSLYPNYGSSQLSSGASPFSSLLASPFASPYGSSSASAFSSSLSPYVADPLQSLLQPSIGQSTPASSSDGMMQMIMMLLMTRLLGRRQSQPDNFLSQIGTPSPFDLLSGLPNNTLSQIATPSSLFAPPPPSPTWSGNSGGTWGDPHFKDLTNKSANVYVTDYDVTGEVGKVYSILSDKNLQFNSRFIKGDPTQGTIMGQMGIKLRGDDGKEVLVEFDAETGKGKVDGKDVPDGHKLTLKMDGEDATVEFKKGAVYGGTGQTVAIHTKEYDIKLEQTLDKNHANQTVKVNKDGVMTDWVNPHGLLGQTADGDDNLRVGKKGVGVQGEGAIDFTYKKYEVSDLFATADRDINRYGIQVGHVMQGGKVVKTYNKATGELLTTLDKDGKLVSVRKSEQADGSTKLFLADGVTEITRSGEIIKKAEPEADKAKAKA